MKLTQTQMLQLVLSDLESWAINASDRTNALLYAIDNGYRLHAASLWLSTGACSDHVINQVKGLKINRKKELKEIKDLISSADIYICKECNAHHFVAKNDYKIDQCNNCLSNNLNLEGA